MLTSWLFNLLEDCGKLLLLLLFGCLLLFVVVVVESCFVCSWLYLAISSAFAALPSFLGERSFHLLRDSLYPL
jgi:hypothetical protein